MTRRRAIAYWTCVALLALTLLIVVVSMFDTGVWWLDLPSQFRWHQFLFFLAALALLIDLPRFRQVATSFVRVRSSDGFRVRSPRLLVVLVGLGLLITSYDMGRHAGWHWLSRSPASGTQLTIVHVNLGDRRGDWQNVIRWLEQQRADVIFLQEARPSFERELNESPLARHVVLRNVRPDSRGTVAIVTNGAELLDVRLDVETFKQTARQMAALTVRKGGRTSTLLSMHMSRPTNATEFGKQSYEIQQLGQWFASHPDGIAIGDINCAPYSPRLASMLRANGLQASTEGTWPTPLPAFLSIPIDSLIVPNAMRIVSVDAGPNLGSDHRPLMATVRLGS